MALYEQDRRNTNRLDLTVDITFDNFTIAQEAKTVNMSVGGLFITTERPMPVGTKLNITLGPNKVAAEGMVVHVTESQPHDANLVPGMGVYFTSISDGARALMEELGVISCEDRMDEALFAEAAEEAFATDGAEEAGACEEAAEEAAEETAEETAEEGKGKRKRRRRKKKAAEE